MLTFEHLKHLVGLGRGSQIKAAHLVQLPLVIQTVTELSLVSGLLIDHLEVVGSGIEKKPHDLVGSCVGIISPGWGGASHSNGNIIHSCTFKNHGPLINPGRTGRQSASRHPQHPAGLDEGTGNVCFSRGQQVKGTS